MYDGGSMTSAIIGKYCDSTPPDVITTSNEIFVHFETNGGNTDVGFKMTYAPTSNRQKLTSVKFQINLVPIGIFFLFSSRM